MKKYTIVIGLLFILLLSSKSIHAQVVYGQYNPVYEYWNTTSHKHFYTCNINELGPNGGSGWVFDRTIGKLWNIPGNPPAGYLQPIYRFYQASSGAHYYTYNRNSYPEGFVYEGILGYTNGDAPLTNIYEWYNSGDYYYTPSGQPSGYHLNGVAWQVN